MKDDLFVMLEELDLLPLDLRNESKASIWIAYLLNTSAMDEACIRGINLTGRLLRESTWPGILRCHWLHPLHNKSAVLQAGSYIGVYLTSIIPKIAERVCSHFRIPPRFVHQRLWRCTVGLSTQTELQTFADLTHRALAANVFAAQSRCLVLRGHL